VIKEVVKKEVLKLLHAGIIYSISNSEWVSPVQVLPKKGGMTVVKNKKNELTPQRTIMGWWICIDYQKLNKAIASFQRCMMSIFYDMIEEIMEVFMEDFFCL
jgi:hypothetical protein